MSVHSDTPVLADPSLRRTLFAAGLASLSGVLALFALSDRIMHPFARAVALLGVAAASAAPAVFVGVLIAPRASSLRVRHIVAGASAAWVCVELAGVARRLGIADESSLFRVAWAPIVEEVAKALAFALLATSRDRDGDRAAIATAGVGVGVGFAFRENVAYFGSALDGGALSLPWLVLRAFPPVFAHALFGATYGTILAQAAIHARAEGTHPSRLSWVALTCAVLAHGVYNGVPWVILAVAPHVTVPFAVGWSIAALLAAVALAARVRAAHREDLDGRDRVSLLDVSLPNDPPGSDDDRQRRALLVLALSALALWAPPLAIVRYLAVVLTPFSAGALVTLWVARALGVARVLPWLALGLTVRPFFAMAEGILGATIGHLGGSLGAPLASLARAGLWVLWSLWLGGRVGRVHGPSNAIVATVGSLAGMIAASLGANLANGQRFAPASAMLAALLSILPRTLLLAGLLGALSAHAHATRRIAGLAGLGAALLVVSSDRVIALGRWPLVAGLALLCAAIARGLLQRGRRGGAASEGVGGVALTPDERAGEVLAGDQPEGVSSLREGP